VCTIENRDLKADFSTIPTFRRVEDPMHRRFRILAGLQQIQRLKEHTTETAKIPHQFSQLRIVTGRQMGWVLKGRIEVELKPNLDDPIRPILHIEGVVVEANLPRDNHVSQILLARIRICQN
jgi:hypothetical protein